MPLTLPSVSCIKEKVAFGISFIKCAWELLSDRLADGDTNVDDSDCSNHVSVAKSILQHGRLKTALLSAAVENMACLIFLKNHGLLEVSNRVLPMVRFRTRATLEFMRDYLSQKAIYIAGKTGRAVQHTATGNRMMYFALSHIVTLKTTHFELYDFFGNYFIQPTLRRVWSWIEWILDLLSNSLNEMNKVIAHESQHSMAIWIMYILARSLFAINLCSISIALAFLSVYTCETSQKVPSLTKGVSQLSSSGEDLPIDISMILYMTSVFDVLEGDTTIPVTSLGSEVVAIDDDSSISAAVSRGIVPLIEVGGVKFFAEKHTTEINILGSTIKENGPDLSRPKENDNQISDVDADDDRQERQTEDVTPKLFEVESDSTSSLNESIKIMITSSLSEDESPLSPNEQNASGILEKSKNTAQGGSLATYDDIDLDTVNGRLVAEEIPPSYSNNDTSDPNKENRFLPKSRDRSLSSEIRAWARLSISSFGKENDPYMTVRQHDKCKDKERTDESSAIDMLEDLIYGRFDQTLFLNSKAQIGAMSSFSVHLDTDAADVRQLASSQLSPTEPTTKTRDQLDLFSNATNYHEEKYKIKSRMPPANSKLYDKYSASAPDVSVNKNDELQITPRILLESIHTINSNSPIFVIRHMRTNGFGNQAQPLPLHWSPALGGPIVAPTSRRRGRLGALATGNKRKDNLTRRTLS